MKNSFRLCSVFNTRQLSVVVLVLALMAGLPFAANSNEPGSTPILIRPFGDSITYGFGFTDYTYCPVYSSSQQWCKVPSPYGGGYRGWLTWITIASLQTNATPPFIFMTEGHQSGGSSSWQWNTATQAHDGYPGYRTDQLIEASKYPSFSDVTLVHAGTNDIAQGINIDTAANNLFKIVDNLLANNGKTHIYLAQIIPFAKPASNCSFGGKPCYDFTSKNGEVASYNQLISQKYQALDTTKKSRVTLVDMGSLLNGQSGSSLDDDYFLDGVHPNVMGYQKIACAWIRGINNLAPSITFPCEGIGPKPPMPFTTPPAPPTPEEMDEMMKYLQSKQ